jgi:hypothetical protein
MEEVLMRFWENLIGRWDGPMSLRILIQPTVATLLAIRAGLRDAREGKPPFLWKILTRPDQRRELLRQGWKDVGTVFLLALLLDATYQLFFQGGVYTLELLVVATLLAIVPYCLIRGLVTRVAARPGISASPISGRRAPRLVRRR